MLAFPAHPRYARMLLAAHELGCIPAAALIAALTQGRNPLRRAEGKRMQQDRDELLGKCVDSDFFSANARAPLCREDELQSAALPRARDQCPGRTRSRRACRAIPQDRS